MINISFTYNAKLTAGNRALYFFFLLGILLTAKLFTKVHKIFATTSLKRLRP